MAVLEKIRSNAGLVVGFVGLGLFAFVIGDALQSGNTFWGQDNLTVLSIDGEDVSYIDYDSRIQQLSEMQGGQLTDEQRMMLNNQLSQEYIQDYALSKLAGQVGLKVTPEETYALLHGGQGIAPSRTATQFFAGFGIDINNPEAVNDFITQMSDTNINSMPEESRPQMLMLQARWKQVQKAIVNERMQQKLASLLSRTYKVTQLDQDLATAQGTRTVAMVRTVAPLISDSTQMATDAEIKAYYDKNLLRYEMLTPMTQVSYISTQVTPSNEDYQAAEQEASKVLAELTSATPEEAETLVRNYSTNFVSTAYLTAGELERVGLSATEIDFVKGAEVGAVRPSGLINDQHVLVKVLGKKSGTESLNVRYMMLDSAMSTKVDSLQAELRAGTSFADLARKHSVDPQAATNGGLIEVRNELGLNDSNITEYTAEMIKNQSGIAFDEVFRTPIGTPIVLGQPNSRILLLAENAKPAVDKYRIAMVTVPATFSQKTYDGRLSALNRILGEGGSFQDMAIKAEKEGFVVNREEYLSVGSPAIGRIPGSRALVHWALNAEAGATTDKVHAIGTDYLAIATVDKQIPAGTAPLALVRDNIKAAVESEKRAEALASQLASKKLTSLDAYAAELSTKVDTLVGVSYLVRGSEAAAFNGKAMTTAIGQLSAPFVAGHEVMVVQPVSQEAANASAAATQSRQQEANVGYQIFSRAFASFVQGLKVEDLRSKFY